MGPTLTDIIGAVGADGPLPRKIKRKIEAAGSEAVVTVEYLAYLVNWAQAEIANEIQTLNKPVLVSSFVLDTVAGQKRYTLPAHCRKIKRVAMLWLAGGEVELSYIPFEQAFDLPGWRGGQTPAGWSLENDDLILLPTPTASKANFARVSFAREAPDLFRAKVDSASGGGTVIVLETSDAANAGPQESLEDWYEAVWVKVVGGAGVGQAAKVTASEWSGGLRLTLETALAGVDTTSIVELQSALPRAATNALVARAALQWALDNKEVDDRGRLAQEWETARAQLRRDLSRDQLAQADEIRDVRPI